MKKLVRLFALVAMMVIGGQAMAQTRGAMFLGASFPMSDFGEFDGFNEFALTQYDESDAGAGIGFNVGLKWYFNVGVEGLGIMLSADGFYNGPNSDLKTAYRNDNLWYDGWADIENFSFSSTPKYINVPVMLGINYRYYLNPNFGIYVEAGAGGNLGLITEMETSFDSRVSAIHGKYKVTTNYDKAFSFAYQAGAGIEVAKNLVVGCSFYHLGSRQVEGNRTMKMVDGNAGPYNESEYLKFGKITPIMVLGRIGFSF
ncbi:MAG: outer membrane beta-barrel protein [Bacteroidales bacterium]|nr:outer membrane beta-barrel protein [Bacteroidales bacterium]